ncbi:uncharacterized protein LOC126697721 isoform X2 [Quercus robur]|uniref:uncharacterized protein LOC126697721 isoform X2 n=1 Tax=Quercus robur TaxID=38942 RepID=UPI00216321E3|nr:uncharacterized protein LOC126697721 isoform X2 [Quercus robur]
MELEKDQLGPLNKRFKQDPSLQPTMESVTEPAEADSKSICEPSIQPPSVHSSDSGVTEADQLDPHKHSLSLQATMESVTESSDSISEFPCELSIQEPSDQSSDSFFFGNAVEKIFLSYPDWNSKAVLMEKLKDSGLELDKVAQDFDKLTPPESSKNIIFRFIHYDDKSYSFAWIEKITDAMKAKPRKIQLRKHNGRRKFNYAIPIYDPTVDSDAFDLILDDVEKCYWPMVLRRVLHDDEDYGDSYKSDEDYIEVVNEDAVEVVNEDADKDVNEDAVEDENEDADEDDDYEIKNRDRFDLQEIRNEDAVEDENEDAVEDENEDADEDDDYEIKNRDRFDLQEIRMRMRFKPKKSYKEDDDDDDDEEEEEEDNDDRKFYDPYF